MRSASDRKSAGTTRSEQDHSRPTIQGVLMSGPDYRHRHTTRTLASLYVDLLRGAKSCLRSRASPTGTSGCSSGTQERDIGTATCHARRRRPGGDGGIGAGQSMRPPEASRLVDNVARLQPERRFRFKGARRDEWCDFSGSG